MIVILLKDRLVMYNMVYLANLPYAIQHICYGQSADRNCLEVFESSGGQSLPKGYTYYLSLEYIWMCAGSCQISLLKIVENFRDDVGSVFSIFKYFLFIS